jgi:uncharacterized protein YcbX
VTASLARLCRHPVKSAGYEEVAAAVLTEGCAFPFDRVWAVAHAAAKFGPEGPAGWAAKLNFLRGWGSADLMAVACVSDPAARRVTLSHPRRPTATFAPDRDGAALADWLRPLWPAVRPDPAFVVSLPGQAMTDVPDPWIAVLGLESNRALSRRLQTDLSIHRWRGNLWVEGWEPFSELDLAGREIAVGGAVLRVEARITRCRATEANPATGDFDARTLAALEEGWGHQDFGVYARVIRGGPVALGDRVVLR